jgi:hypothetical protein
MDVREKYVIQKVNQKEKSICLNCIHHNLCIAENNQTCFECNRFMDAHGVTVQEWISVKDRLPKNICPVLVALEGISTAFNGWYHDGKWWTAGADTRPFIQKVTHWMPLPQPPKEDV